MNLINYKKNVSKFEGQYLVSEWRKIDHNKIYEFLNNMMQNAKKLNNDFKSSINFTNEIKNYASYKDEDIIKIDFKWELDGLNSEFSLRYPNLVKDNYFLLNGNTYIPLLFLERAPIDKIQKDDVEKIFVNLIPTFNFTFDFKDKNVNIRGKNISIYVFNFILFGSTGIPEDSEYCEYLLEHKLINENYKEMDYNKCITEITKLIGIEKVESFKNLNITIDEFFDNYLLLDYFKEVFNQYFGVSNFKDIVKKVYQYHINALHPEMADLNNRRVVMTEYLLHPLFELYIRLIFIILNKNSKTIRLPSANDRVLLSGGFKGIMHNGMLFNSSLPYTAPLVHKISQDIIIIKNGVPRNWTSNHDSAFGIICPISVSAQNMGSNLVFTQDTHINKYGKIKTN